MNVRWLFLAFVFLFVVYSAQAQDRRRSKFRRKKNPNPFDLTQPQVAASVQSKTTIENSVPRIARRRIGPGNVPADENRTLRKRVGALSGRRRRPAGRRRAIQQATKKASVNQQNVKVPTKNKLRVRRPKPNRKSFNQLAAISNDVTPVISSSKGDGYKIVCYYTNWSQYRTKIGKFMPEDIDPHMCTHIIYAFGWLKKGRLSSFEANDESKDGKIGFYEKITGLKRQNPKLKVLLALGGWTFGTKRFRDMAKSRYSRQRFIFSAIPFLRKHNFDGLDLDWEYPSGKDDKNNLNLLCKELIVAFQAESEETKKERLLLSAAVAVGPDKVKGGYDAPTLAKYLDFVNVMAYDFHGKWENTVGHNAPLYAPSIDSEWRQQLSVSYASNLWSRLGIPKEKLIIGMPTYGRSFTLSNPIATNVNSPASGGGVAGKYTGEEGFLAYYEVCQMLHAGGAYYWHEEMQVPYMVKGNLWVGFDDERATRNKMKWVKENGFGGAMIWSIDMDDFKGTVCGGGIKYPLISIMREELLGIPRGGNDVDWSRITSTSVARYTTLPPPIAFDPIPGLLAQLATPSTLNVHSLVIPSVPKDAPKVVCYMTSWAHKRGGAGRFEPENIDPFLCTHVIYAFGTLKEHRLAPAHPFDLGDGIKQGMFERLMALKEKNPKLKVILALGGWEFGSKPFKELVTNQFRMNGFVYDSIEFLRLHKFDGLDIDWEYPQGADDKANFANLLRELRIAFEGEAASSKQPRLLLSAAVPASYEAMFAGYDVPEISKYLDFFNLMTYDFHGQWEEKVGHNSPLFPLVVASSYEKKMTIDYSVNAWLKEGAPAQKIMLGMPAYGRSFTLADPTKFDIGAPSTSGGKEGRYTKEPGFLSYYEICEFLFEDNTTLVWDNEQQVPFAYREDQWVGFDDERSYEIKMEWLKEMGLGGVMIWSTDMDDFRGNCGGKKFPLLNTVVDSFGNYSVALTYNGPYENTGTLEGTLQDLDPNEIRCEEAEGHISYYKDVTDCTRYYMCEGERKHHMPCPNQLVFNIDQNVCDWPENVEGCGATPSPAR